VAVSINDDSALSADVSGQDFISILAHSDASDHLVIDASGSVLGVLSTEDVERALAQR
jgi:CBS-domain-containing membrane protein